MDQSLIDQLIGHKYEISEEIHIQRIDYNSDNNYLNKHLTKINSDLNQTIDFSEVDANKLLEITESVHSLYDEFDNNNNNDDNDIICIGEIQRYYPVHTSE